MGMGVRNTAMQHGGQGKDKRAFDAAQFVKGHIAVIELAVLTLALRDLVHETLNTRR